MGAREHALRASVAAVFLAAACARTGERSADTSAGRVDSASADRTALPAPPDSAGAATPAPDSGTTASSRNTGGATPRPAPVRAGTGGDTATRTSTPTVTPSEMVVTGKIVPTGPAGAPITQLEIEGAPALTLVGALEPELRRLGGARVWVAGGRVASPPNAFEATRYEIVAIDGVKPVVGVLRMRGDALTLVAGTDTLTIASAPAELRTRPGAKVWIIGRRAGSELTPQSYGIITP